MKRMRKGRILAAATLLAFTACGDAPQEVSEQALRSWPPEPQQPLDVAENLLAANYYVVLDGSGSMSERKCSSGKSKSQASKQALEIFANSIPADANLGLLAFDAYGVRERLKLGANNREDFINRVRSTKPQGGTPLRSAIGAAYESLVYQGQRQLGYGEYHLVVVTDGIASTREEPDDLVDKIVGGSPVLLHTIGFCIGSEHSLNQPGRTLYKEANNPEELQAGLQSVLAEAPSFDVTNF